MERIERLQQLSKERHKDKPVKKKLLYGIFKPRKKYTYKKRSLVVKMRKKKPAPQIDWSKVERFAKSWR